MILKVIFQGMLLSMPSYMGHYSCLGHYHIWHGLILNGGGREKRYTSCAEELNPTTHVNAIPCPAVAKLNMSLPCNIVVWF